MSLLGSFKMALDSWRRGPSAVQIKGVSMLRQPTSESLRWEMVSEKGLSIDAVFGPLGQLVDC